MARLIHKSHHIQQVFVGKRVAEIFEILDTTGVSQIDINNPADIRTRAINVEALKAGEWLTGPAWLKEPDSKRPEQVKLIFALDDQNEQTVFSFTT